MVSQNSNFAQHLNFLTYSIGKPSYLAGLLEDQMKSYINKSIIHSIIDIIVVPSATEPEQRMLTSTECSNPGIQWLPGGCSLDLQKNGDCGNHVSPIHRFLNNWLYAGEMIWLWGGVVASPTQLLWLWKFNLKQPKHSFYNVHCWLLNYV